MRPLSTTELLQVWEIGLQKQQVDRWLNLLYAASTTGDADPATLSIGQRDLRLLQLREWMFGSKLLNTAICPCCGQKIEWENEVKDFKLQPMKQSSNLQRFELVEEGFQIGFRLPVSEDMRLLRADIPMEENEKILLKQCLTDVQNDNGPCLVEDLPPHILEIVEEHISQEDPQADITILLNCPDCKHQWNASFDIQNYLWTEINAWAKNILQEIYVLARHFGWQEHDILSMSPQRRQLYLQMIFA